MKFQQRLHTAIAVLAVAISVQSAKALVSLEDGKDHLFINGTVDMGYDSNIFTNSTDKGGLVYQGTLGTEFTRRAGWIGVNMTASLAWARYADFRSQDYVDPKVTAELTKLTGRTTGSLTFLLQRQNRADVDVNTRDISWNYDVGLNFQYPVIERYSISGSLEYDRTDYQDQALFSNQTSYSGNLYLYYILNEQRDLFIDYRARYTDESKGISDVDNSLSLGVSGKVIGPFNGSFQVGYQVRSPTGGAQGPAAGTYHDLTATGTLTWNLSRRMTLTGDLSRDYSTTATAFSIDTTRGGLTFQDSFTAKASGTIEAAAGENVFLGEQGLTAPGGSRRVDKFATVSLSYFYTLNQHLKVYATYVWYQNWSTLPFADFPRDQIDVGLSSHW